MSVLQHHANGISTCSSSKLLVGLCEYRYLVHRFPQWLALTVAKTDDPVIRQLLLPNLVEESGLKDDAPSHLELLDKCLNACGCNWRQHRVTVCTVVAESWFYGTFASQELAACLGALGPGTEEISSQFLDPLEMAVRKNFSVAENDLIYFHEHRPEVEQGHVDGLRKSIERLIEISGRENELRIREQVRLWSDAAIYTHGLFWRDVAESLGEN